VSDAQFSDALGANETQLDEKSAFEAAVVAYEEASGATRDEAIEEVRAILRTADALNIKVSASSRKILKDIQNGIEEAISRQLREVMHNDDFRELEGSWRGLNRLVRRTNTGDQLRIKVLNVTKDELAQDFDTDDPRRTLLYQHVWRDEFDQPGGSPFLTLVCDYGFKNATTDLSVLENLGRLGEVCHCQIVSSIAPEMLGLSSFDQIRNLDDLERDMNDKAYTRWQAFRNSETSRNVVLTMANMLAREPYGAGDGERPDRGFGFQEFERPEAMSQSALCWTSSAYALAERLNDTFDRTGWCSDIRGKKNAVEEIPVYKDFGPTDVRIPMTDGAELGNVGLLPLAQYKNENFAVFFGSQTVQRAKDYGSNTAATENAQISARLPYMLVSKRIAHLLQAMGRDSIGSFKEADDLKRHITNWIKDFVSTDENPSEEMRARYPIREFSVEVEPVPGKSGEYTAKIRMRPWLQVEQLNAAVSMVAQIKTNRG